MTTALAHFPQHPWRWGKLVWVLPTFLLAVAIDVAFLSGSFFPIPFLLLLVTVSVAGSFGGFSARITAGLHASIEIFLAFRLGFGPVELTGGWPQASLGAFVFTIVGAHLGWLKDNNEAAFADLRKTKLTLAAGLEEASRERNEEAARVSDRDDQLRHAMRLSGIGFFKWNVLTGDCEYCSEQHAAHFGLSPREFQYVTRGPAPFTGFVHKEDRTAFLESVAQVNDGVAMPFDYRIIRPDGQTRYIRQINEPIFDETGVEIAVVGSSIDFTDLHEAEERLCQAQRIETIGNLTGGVAHDFNNLLAIVLGNLELALELEDPKTKADLIQEGIKATKLGANLTKSLLSFARRAHLTPERVNVNELVDTTVIWASRILPENISIETSLYAGLWDAELDADSAEHAIVNLFLNARDAMAGGGRLTLETTNLEVTENQKHHENLDPGRYVVLAVSDTGHGISEDKLEQIFEPFFTDKPVGSGTGLGLSMVQGFMTQSNGAIRVQSEVAKGTTFKMFFKAAEGTPNTIAPASTNTKPTSPDSLRILLVEDDDDVSRILKSIFETAGHAVASGSTGDDAWEIFKTSGGFDIVVTDVVMPGTLQGPALVRAIRALKPDMPCVFLSGYASDNHDHDSQLQASDIHLMKPASRDQLLAAVSDAWKARNAQDLVKIDA